MPTNMIIFKSPEHSCLWICNVDDAKVIDRIWTCSKLIFQPNQINTTLKQEIKNTLHKDGKSTNKVV